MMNSNRRKPSLFTALVLGLPLLLSACASPQRQVKNWDDPRCYTYTDVVRRIGNKNSMASALAFLGGDMRSAVNLSTYAPTHWIEGYSGDGRRVFVGYTDDHVVIGYKDLQGQDLSVSDLKNLGPVITKYSDLARYDPIYQQKKAEARMFPLANPDIGTPFLAAPIPAVCE